MKRIAVTASPNGAQRGCVLSQPLWGCPSGRLTRDMKIHHLTVEDAFASVQSRPEGLSASEAARRWVEFGPNQVERVRREPLLPRFLKG